MTLFYLGYYIEVTPGERDYTRRQLSLNNSQCSNQRGMVFNFKQTRISSDLQMKRLCRPMTSEFNEQRGYKVAPPSFVLNIAVAWRNFQFCFNVFLEPSKPDGKRWDFRNSPTRYRITSPEVKVVWMIFWWKYDKLGDYWIKGRESPLKQMQRCCICFWGCRSHRCW